MSCKLIFCVILSLASIFFQERHYDKDTPSSPFLSPDFLYSTLSWKRVKNILVS